ncbi:MAG TPA: HD domain-containing protein [Solirubrobacteraceae bacterium]|nr:HD domain-containing protein [Solirubrobacteraceae bacterium]
MRCEPPALTSRFLAAVRLAQEIHGHDRRTGTEIPYLAHLLVVTGLVIEDGGDEDQAIAAMLHDAVEDGGGRPLLEQIARDFGARVAAIVEACSDTIDLNPAESWIQRKQRYLAHLPHVTDDAVLRVALADKVHNARSIVRDYREEGHALWDRFTQKTAREQLWYYGGLLGYFRDRRPGPLTEDLRRAVAELAWLVAQDDAERSAVIRLWVDPDLHRGQAPDGWVHVCTAEEAIAVLDCYVVTVISLGTSRDAERVIDWLNEQSDSEQRDRWPLEQIGFHGEWTRGAEIERLCGSIGALGAGGRARR